MPTKKAIEYFPAALRDFELYPKVSEMLDYIMSNCVTQFIDIEKKFGDPANITEDIFAEVLKEFGFRYINDVAETTTSVDRSLLFHFIGLLHFYKGTQQGLELVLDVLGMSADIVNWWERPEGEMEPFTFNMTVSMNLSNLKRDVLTTLKIIREFTKHYVYPTFKKANVSFVFDFASVNTACAGFSSRRAFGSIEATI